MGKEKGEEWGRRGTEASGQGEGRRVGKKRSGGGCGERGREEIGEEEEGTRGEEEKGGEWERIGAEERRRLRKEKELGTSVLHGCTLCVSIPCVYVQTQAIKILENYNLQNADEERSMNEVLVKVYLNAAQCSLELGQQGRVISYSRKVNV